MSDQLQAQLDQANTHIRGLVAQLDSAKQMFNESVSANLQLRATLNLLTQSNQEIQEKSSRQISELSAKILELSPPVMNEVLTPA